MTNLNLINKSDNQLKSIIASITDEVSSLLKELTIVTQMSQMKSHIQQQNKVLVTKIIRDNKNNPISTSDEVMTLKSAIKYLENDIGPYSEENKNRHYKIWERDGYDLKTTIKLLN